MGLGTKKIEVTTLQDFPEEGYSFGRRTGNSTRIADHAIQLLFKGFKIHVKDSWQNGRHMDANYFLFIKIAERLEREHQGVKFKADKAHLTIELL